MDDAKGHLQSHGQVAQNREARRFQVVNGLGVKDMM